MISNKKIAYLGLPLVLMGGLTYLSAKSVGKPNGRIGTTITKRRTQSSGPIKATKTKAKSPLRPKAVSGSKKLEIRLGKPVTYSVEKEWKHGTVQLNLASPMKGKLVFTYSDFKDARTGLAVLDMTQTGLNATDAAKQKIKAQLTVFTFGKLISKEYADRYAVHSPQFSPDGQSVVFKAGEVVSDITSFDLYILDLRTQRIRFVTDRRVAYKYVSWSPDGRYLAYVEGGDDVGGTAFYVANQEIPLGPRTLYVCDLKTNTEISVVQNDTVSGPFRWIAPHTLLYSLLAEHQPQNKQKTKAVARPSIFEYDAATRQSSLIIPDGHLPHPSPDSNLMAYFGSEDKSAPRKLPYEWRFDAKGMALIVSRRDGSGRIPLDVEKESYSYPKLVWLSDNRHLLTIDEVDAGPVVTAEIKQWDVQSATFKAVAKVPATGYDELLSVPLFDLLKPTLDSSGLLIGFPEWNRVAGQPGWRNLTYVDLKSCDVTSVVKVKGASDIDWHSDL